MNFIDLNTDIGEAFPYDKKLLQLVSSCNIACGGHTGSNESMRETILLAKHNNIKIGAHPSYPDKENFGRKEIEISPSQLKISLKNQINSLINIALEENEKVAYVKPHGALYNVAMKDISVAQTIINACRESNTELAIMGMPNSVLEQLCLQQEIIFIKESFADRRYTKEGQLVSRKMKNAVIYNKTEVWYQVEQLINNNRLQAINGEWITLQTDSICFHGDTPKALELLQYVVKQLNNSIIEIKAFL